MTDGEPDEYLAVLKASYDYRPQSEDEIAIKENQLLFLKERVDEDWWKVKIKGESQEEDSPVGLVPAAYVEPASPTSTVKVLYDYDATAPGELSVKEDEILLVFETEQDWLLVQSQDADGRAGFVPGNYVETYSEETPAAPQIIVPSSPPRPVSTYIDPADRVASAKVTADGIKTWSVSEIDKKGKKKKGTLGVGNGAVFFASEADKTPVQKWQTIDIQNVASEKSKHITVDVGGTVPIVLHFHAGSKENVDAIISKLKTSKALSEQPGISDASASDHPVSSPASPSREVKKAQVHFSHASPTIIPTRADTTDDEDGDEGEEGGRGEDLGPTAINGTTTSSDHTEESGSGIALYDFAADGSDELSISEGEHLIILERDGDEWWKCRNLHGVEGVVPASYIEATTSSVVSMREKEIAMKETELQAEAERIEREQQMEREEKARKKLEAQKRAKDAAAAAEAERKKRKEAAAAAAARISPPPATGDTRKQTVEGPVVPNSPRTSAEPNNRPPPERTRIWHDRSGQFRVEAAFLGFSNGKLRLHKINGVIVEVPSEKMSVEDMQYVDKITSRKSRPTKQISEDDIPLGISRSNISSAPSPAPNATKKAPRIDWFDFFLSAGCDLDDCTRYAASFERDKIDESILPDITDATMRSLGLREGDIIRVTKAIEKRKPTDNLVKPSSYAEEQLRRDEELARQLQAQESGGSSKSPPNLFTGPGGVLKNPRRGRPQPSKSLPPSNVDLKAISTVSDQITRTASPQMTSPANGHPPSESIRPPPRSSSAVPITSGFDDEAWTNRPSSTKPLVGTPPATAPRAPSAPPVVVAPPTLPEPTPTTSAPPAQPTSTPLSKTTESDIFDQLSRLSELRNKPPQLPVSTSPSLNPPINHQVGPGMGSSPSPVTQHMQNSQLGTSSHMSPQPYNGPRGPFAPVPANQGLLQPLIPTQTGFNNFVPARPGLTVSPFQGQQTQPSFIAQQPTGIPVTQPIMSQPTGMPFSGFNSVPHQMTGAFGPVHSQFTGFNPNFAQPTFNNGMSPPPVPPLPQSSSNNTSPANIFAQMKSGTFAADHSGVNPQTSDKYDALRPNTLAPQPTGWSQPYQGGYMGYQR